MNAGKVSVRNEVTRRTVLGAGVASAVLATAGLALAQQSAPAQQAPLLKGPPVWLDMDQAELDAAYDQSNYAPNLAQITARYATNSSRSTCASPNGSSAARRNDSSSSGIS